MTVDGAKNQNTAIGIYTTDACFANGLTDGYDITLVDVEIAQVCVPGLNTKTVVENNVVSKGIGMTGCYDLAAGYRGNCRTVCG